MSDRAFLGTGMKFPPQIDPGTGRFAVSTREQSVRESVYLILMTHQGERWLEPGFGSRMGSNPSVMFFSTIPLRYRYLNNTETEERLRARDLLEFS